MINWFFICQRLNLNKHTWVLLRQCKGNYWFERSVFCKWRVYVINYDIYRYVNEKYRKICHHITFLPLIFFLAIIRKPPAINPFIQLEKLFWWKADTLNYIFIWHLLWTARNIIIEMTKFYKRWVVCDHYNFSFNQSIATR